MLVQVVVWIPGYTLFKPKECYIITDKVAWNDHVTF